MTLTIGVDVGGTKVAAGVVDEGGHILAQTRRDTAARNAAATHDAIVDAVKELLAQHEVEAVGLAAAGLVDETRSTMLFSANVPAWRGQALRDDLGGALGIPVIVENDANAAAWGEVLYGAGRGEEHVVCITVGTGIGGGLVLYGQLYRGRFGVGVEYGHMRFVPDGRACGCGNRGCWEQYASGNALVREARERAAEDREHADILLGLGDGEPEGIKGRDVTEAARLGDPVAVASFDAVGRQLGAGMADLAAILDPGLFVIGGGVSEAGELLLGPARAAYVEALTGGGHRPLAEVRRAELGNAAGIVGVAELARRR
jgi:glucokinase